MNKTVHRVAVIGGGISGLSAALELAILNYKVTLIEQAEFLGGHGITLSCKAADACVQCGACVVENRLGKVVAHPNVRILLGSRIESVKQTDGFSLDISQSARFIDPGKCTACGICYDRCPETGAVLKGYSKNNLPFFGISSASCLHLQGDSCTVCEDQCPEHAIRLDAEEEHHTVKTDAVIVATGFKPFDPEKKPYGFGTFKNVVTNMDLEQMLRQAGRVYRPSDGKRPKTIAFIQCVGSRDAALNHLWCSRVCCPSALRLAHRIKFMQPASAITIFFMDIQSFGKDFNRFREAVQNRFQWIRTLPADILETDTDQLQVSYFDSKAVDAVFDMVVLSVGLIPHTENLDLLHRLGYAGAETDLSRDFQNNTLSFGNGIFGAGTLMTPMGIADSLTSASEAVWNVKRYLENGHPQGE